MTAGSWDAIRNIFCPIICCASLFITPDSIFSFDHLIQTSLWYRYLPWLTSYAAPDFSPLYAFPLVASIMQPRSSLIFLFLHPPVISTKSLAADFGFPFSRVVCNLAEIIEEILAEIQESKLQSAGFDSLKTWAGTGKGKKGVRVFWIK